MQVFKASLNTGALLEDMLRLLELYRRYEQLRPARRQESVDDDFLEEIERRNPHFSRCRFTSE